jgi:hypothetical protein
MSSKRPNIALIVILVVVIVAAVVVFVKAGGTRAFSGPQRSPGEQVDLTPTPEHPNMPGLGGGGR